MNSKHYEPGTKLKGYWKTEPNEYNVKHSYIETTKGENTGLHWPNEWNTAMYRFYRAPPP